MQVTIPKMPGIKLPSITVDHKSPYFYVVLLIISVLITGIIFQLGFMAVGFSMVAVSVILFVMIIAHAG